MTPFHDDDPRTTQHLLEGLEGEDLATLERWLDEAARSELQHRARLIEDAREALRHPTPAGLGEEQRAAIRDAAGEEACRADRRGWRGQVAVGTLVAAAVVTLAVVHFERSGDHAPQAAAPAQPPAESQTTPDRSASAFMVEPQGSSSSGAPGPQTAAPAAAPPAPPRAGEARAALRARPAARAFAPGRSPARRESRAGEQPTREQLDLLQRMGAASAATPRSRPQGALRASSRSSMRASAGAFSPPAALAPGSRNSHDDHGESGFVAVETQPRSTFGLDVDSGSYSLVRRYIESDRRPPPSSVRLEEMLNAFRYDDPAPAAGDARPVRVHTEVGVAPWDRSHRLVRVGVRARDVAADARPPANLVFLIDTSGSMAAHDRLPWVKRGLLALAEQLTARDTLSIVTYASGAQMTLPSTPGNRVQTIVAAIEQLEASGGTNGGQGLELAYAQAEQHRLKGGINRVVLASDGDFNVGVTSRDALEAFVRERAQRGIALTVLGYGMGGYRDSRLEQLADHGDGNYAYIDGAAEADRVLVRNVTGTLLTVARDVKLQVELNPARVQSYRLLGYENRALATRDFTDDGKDAGELGAGTSVVALYELVPQPAQGEPGWVEPSRYQQAPQSTANEWMTVSVRYKAPEGGPSRAFEVPVPGGVEARTSKDFRFASSVALFGMLLRSSPHIGRGDLNLVRRLAAQGQGDDPDHERRDFAALVERYASLPPATPSTGVSLSHGDITSVLKRHRHALQSCYQASPEGRVRLTVSVSVDADGEVKLAKAHGNAPRAMQQCVEVKVKRWRFPSSGGQTQFAFPVFLPSR